MAYKIKSSVRKYGYLNQSETKRFRQLDDRLGELTQTEFRDWKQLSKKGLGL